MDLKRLSSPTASILVLEEDPFLRAGLCTLLTGAGYGVAEPVEGANALGRIDLVLAGAGAWEALRRLHHPMPVILLVDHAAWCRLDFFDAANDLGAVAVLQRPFSRAALLSLMARALSQPQRAAAPAGRRHREKPLVLVDNPNFA